MKIKMNKKAQNRVRQERRNLVAKHSPSTGTGYHRDRKNCPSRQTQKNQWKKEIHQ